MGDPMKNLELFKSFGISEWIVGNENFKDFFNWFSKNIKTENILFDEEIQEQVDIKKKKQYLLGNDLTNHLNEINNEYPGILSSDENSSRKLERELNNLKSIKYSYEEILSMANETLTNCNKKIKLLHDKIDEIEQEKEENMEKCINTVEQLQDSQLINQKEMMELNKCYEKAQSPPLFIHKLPLEGFYKKYNRFSQLMNIYLQSNFKIQNFFDSITENEENTRFEMDLVTILKERLFNNISELFNVRNDKVGKKAMIEQFRKIDFNEMSWFEMSQQIKYHNKQIQLYQQKLNTLTDYQHEQISRLAEQQAQIVIFHANESKLVRCERRLSHLKHLNEIILDALVNAEMVWILMQLDIERIKQRNNFDKLSHYQKASLACAGRIEQMNNISKHLPETTVENVFLEKLISLLRLHVDRNFNLTDISTVVMQLEIIEKEFAEHFANLKKLSSTETDIQQRILPIEKALTDLVLDGPIDVPMLKDNNMEANLFKCKEEKESIIAKLKNGKNLFLNYIQRMQSDKMWHQGQLLWIWFLTQPIKIIEAIDEIQKEVEKMPLCNMNVTNSAQKSIPGIKRRN